MRIVLFTAVLTIFVCSCNKKKTSNNEINNSIEYRNFKKMIEQIKACQNTIDKLDKGKVAVVSSISYTGLKSNKFNFIINILPNNPNPPAIYVSCNYGGNSGTDYSGCYAKMMIDLLRCGELTNICTDNNADGSNTIEWNNCD